MPTRMIRDGILSSERVALLGWAEEVFYRRLMSAADDYGRYYAHPALIRAACYPLYLDKVSDSDIEKWLTACVNAALVRVYPASDGKRYLQIENFGQRIQCKSKFPSPDSSDSCGSVPETTDLSGAKPESTVDHGELPKSTAVVEGVVEVEGVVGNPRKRAPSKHQIPADFAVSDRVRAWAAEKGHGLLDLHLEHFRMTCAAKGYTYADWDSAFMRAIADNWAKVSANVSALPAGGRRKLA